MLHEPSPREITHGEVGKYFDRFCGTHYKMNDEFLELYPQDLDFIINRGR